MTGVFSKQPAAAAATLVAHSLVLIPLLFLAFIFPLIIFICDESRLAGIRAHGLSVS